MAKEAKEVVNERQKLNIETPFAASTHKRKL